MIREIDHVLEWRRAVRPGPNRQNRHQVEERFMPHTANWIAPPIPDGIRPFTPEGEQRLRRKLVGEKFGRWTVVDVCGIAGGPGRHNSTVWCRCDCGRVCMVYTRNLKRGRSRGCKSCGAKGRT